MQSWSLTPEEKEFFEREIKSLLPEKPREAKNAELNIRFIGVTQNLAVCDYGEFNDNPNALLPSGKTKGSETGEELVERLFTQIQKIAEEIGKPTHLQHNFTHPTEFRSSRQRWQDAEQKTAEAKEPLDAFVNETKKTPTATFLPGHTNDITLVATSEFLFWPCKARGPLTQANLHLLIKKLETYALDLPSNLYFALGSFPIMNADSQVTNMLIFLQCGDTPKVSLTPKLTPFHKDLEYPGTITPYYGEGSLSKHLVEQIEQQLNLLKAAYLSSEAKRDLGTPLTELTRLCNYNPDYREEMNDFAKSLDELAATSNAFYFEKERMFEKLKKTWAITLVKITNRSTFAYIGHLALTKKFIGWTEQAPYGNNILFSTTAGGLKFAIALEICNDFILNTACNVFDRKIQLAEITASERSPSLVVQILSANTTGTLPWLSILGANNQIMQVDPGLYEQREQKHHTSLVKFDPVSYKKVQLDTHIEKSSKLSDVVFATSLCAREFKPFAAPCFREDIQTQIDSQNDFTQQIQALRQYRVQHPLRCDLVNRIIDKKILDYVLTEKNPDNMDTRQIVRLCPEFLSALQQAQKQTSSAAFRAELLPFIEDHITQCRDRRASTTTAACLTKLRGLFTQDNLMLATITLPVAAAETKRERKESTPAFFQSAASSESLQTWLKTGEINLAELQRALTNKPLKELCEEKIISPETLKIIVHDPILYQLFFDEALNKKHLLAIREKAPLALQDPFAFLVFTHELRKLSKHEYARLGDVEKVELFLKYRESPKSQP